jgi:hypothetical protein
MPNRPAEFFATMALSHGRPFSTIHCKRPSSSAIRDDRGKGERGAMHVYYDTDADLNLIKARTSR